VEIGRSEPPEPLPDRYWLHRRGPMSAFVWSYQRAHGRRWYARHARGLPPLRLARERRGASVV